MPLPPETNQDVQKILVASLKAKIANYRPETSFMPFHARLLGRDRMALFSFVHSLNTNFGTSIFEPVAERIARDRFAKAERQLVIGTTISHPAQSVIDDIISSLRGATSDPDKDTEVERIRKVAASGRMIQTKFTKADLGLIDADGHTYYFDLKTAKPNKGNFIEFKRTLLEWTAVALAVDNERLIHTIIAIPYNPYYPASYDRWTLRGMLDLNHELLVAEQFWDFLGGTGTYLELLDIFERVGIEMRDDIDEYFARFNK